MTTPSKITLEQAKEEMRQYIQEQTYRDTDNRMRHHGCGEALQLVATYLSIHNSAWSPECTGAGRVQAVPIPDCPKCEPKPEAHGCIHVPNESNYLTLGEPVI
ncbi:MAG: hypothetical protein U1E51_02010 [Candidatus Binatia bacterium]|nr:hypothetical protein [Candidatus Binatia bacterium]